MKSVAVSFLMSCFNGASFIRDTIESVLNQSYSNFEFVIVNDGSTDESLEILNDYQRADDRIRVVNKLNTGLADSLNVGFMYCSGHWIARIDSDDLALANRVARQLEAINDSSIVFIGSGMIEINEHGAEIKRYSYPTDHDSLVERLCCAGAFPPHSSALIRSDAFKRVGRYRKRIRRSQDWDLWLRLSEVGKLTCIDEPLVSIRKHSAQISNEKAGLAQVLFSRASIVAHHLRCGGSIDPISLDDEIYQRFINMVDVKLKLSGVYDLYLAREAIKSRYRRFFIHRQGMESTLVDFNAFLALRCFLSDRKSTNEMSRMLALEWLEKCAV